MSSGSFLRRLERRLARSVGVDIPTELWVNGKVIYLDPIRARTLVTSDVLYACGEEHGDMLHLNPTYKWDLVAVERLTAAIIGVDR